MICPPRLFTLVLCWGICLSGSALAGLPCRIEVVEQGTGWPVPLVELETTGHDLFVTDNAGVVAFDAPECMHRETWFNVRSHGYELAKDGFGNRGFRCVPTPGGTQRVEIRRTNVARRLGRLTGAGIFAESQKLGAHLDWQESGVTGQDTVEEASYHGKLYWGWGDTNVFSYALGIYKTTGATTPARPLESFEPPLALAFDYFRDDKGAVRPLVNVESPGPIWVGVYTALPDRAGKEHLVCTYSKIKGFLSPDEIGLADWDDATGNWKPTKVLWTRDGGSGKPPFSNNGHSALWSDPEGRRWVYFGEGLPHTRCPANYESWLDQTTWETVENPTSLPSAKDGSPVGIAAGSIAWNEWRKRWVFVFQQAPAHAASTGEVWYAEGGSPAGPWGKAVKVVSHDNYTFYNPRIHASMVPTGSKFILFEGTYTAEFADHARPTARYNYNQILYRLDLDDPALAPARKP